MTPFQAWSVLILGLFLVVFGTIGVTRPYVVAKWEEKMDAIGSTTSLDSVEPTELKVSVTRTKFVIPLLLGLMFSIVALNNLL